MRLFFLLFISGWWLWGNSPTQALNISPAAQSTIISLDTLAVELWPDYDDPTMLLLFTGSLPATMSLPASVSLPLPEGAVIHAVARITDDNVMIDDIAYTTANGMITLETPDRGFRVEYYLPYTVAGFERTFALGLAFPFAINTMSVAVQQPAAATSFTLSPTPQTNLVGQDGLTYYRLADQPLAAGQTLNLSVRYTLPGNQLTVNAAAANTPPSATSPTQNSSTNLPLILAGIGGLILSGTLIWQGLKERKAANTHKKPPVRSRPMPKQNRPARTKRATPQAEPAPTPPTLPIGEIRFCHQCGREAQPEDRFCRQCGTQLKGR